MWMRMHRAHMHRVKVLALCSGGEWAIGISAAGKCQNINGLGYIPGQMLRELHTRYIRRSDYPVHQPLQFG